MDGKSTSESTQSSTTNPWAPSQPILSGILGQLYGQLGNTGVTGAENNALGTIVSNANNASSQFAPAIQSYAQNLLSGGGALNQTGALNSAYQNYYNQTNPLASNTDYNPMNTPGFSDALNTSLSDITNQVNGQFAAAGRDLSGMNTQTLGRGLSQGASQAIANQYNQNVANQQGAAGNLYNAGNTTSGLLSGLNQQALANQGAGVTAAGQAVDAQNAGANATLAAEAQRRGIPVQALGLLAQIGIPIAGLGGTSSGTSNTTQQMSGAQQFGMIAGGLGSLFGGGGGSTAGNMAKLFSDRRLKTDIAQVGALFDGTPVYRYRYKGLPQMHIGVMSDEVSPDAVERVGSFDMVDYEVATKNALEAA